MLVCACVAAFALVLGLPLTYGYGGVGTFGYIAGAGGLSVVLVYLAVNIAVIRAFRTEFRDEFTQRFRTSGVGYDYRVAGVHQMAADCGRYVSRTYKSYFHSQCPPTDGLAK